MGKTFLILSASIGAMILPIWATAQTVDTRKKENLSQTEQRLKDLINAAAKQNLLEVKRSKPGAPTTRQVVSQKLASKPDAATTCGTENLFMFPDKTRVETYAELLLLKSAMVTGPDQIDTEKAQTLALAYLGLGFADEAINIAGYLALEKQAAITAMAHIIDGKTSANPRSILAKNIDCFEAARLWYNLVQENYTPLSTTNLNHLKNLPDKLNAILTLQLALKAVKNDDIRTAKTLFAELQSATQKHDNYDAEISDYLQDDAYQFLAALLAMQNENSRRAGVRQLQALASRESAYQAQALQALAESRNLYPEYLQDLESVTQTYSEQPTGKQAQAQKINYLASQHQFSNAISITQDNFEPGSEYFTQSVIVISQHIQSSLLTDDVNLKLGALDALLSFAGFFAHLANKKPLQHAGVNACVSLGLPKLIPEILPPAQWHELNDTALIFLSLQTSGRNLNIPKRIYATPALVARDIHTAFVRKNPKKARALRGSTLKSEPVHSAYAQAAWNNGYWSLAREDSLQTSGALKLAASLSVLSPTLINNLKPGGLSDLTSLQSYLDGDLKIIRSYLLPAAATATSKTEAANG
ncbi:MAG: hypothetical protein L3J65_04380 [Robiginitomaculum sp.]|nr:hypothetical protein [Robiginitomaculum sp.]